MSTTWRPPPPAPAACCQHVGKPPMVTVLDSRVIVWVCMSILCVIVPFAPILIVGGAVGVSRHADWPVRSRLSYLAGF